MKRIGLLGCGAIGTMIARAIDSAKIDARLVCIYDTSPDASARLASSLDSPPEIAPNAHMLSSNPVDIIVEAASQDAVRDHALSVIQNRRDLVVMSVGALLDESVYEVLSEACSEFGRSIYVPSGAIAGLDALRSVAGEIESITLTTTKHPDSLRGAPGATDLLQDGSAVIFEGSARDAIAKFPRNVNVAALVSLVAARSTDLTVRIVADSSADRNSHDIEARGAFGTIRTRVDNVPDPTNVKTSRLAGLSAIELLRSLCSEGGAIRLGV